jgi:hypothetical protein
MMRRIRVMSITAVVGAGCLRDGVVLQAGPRVVAFAVVVHGAGVGAGSHEKGGGGEKGWELHCFGCLDGFFDSVERRVSVV